GRGAPRPPPGGAGGGRGGGPLGRGRTGGGASRDAMPCATAPAAAASRPSIPFERKAAITPVSTSPVPAVASDESPYPATSTPSSGAATSVSAPLRRTVAP